VLSIIDRYILKQVAVPLGSVFSIGLLMMLAERLVRLLDTTLGKQNSFSVVFEMLAYLVPHYLGTAIPAALFLGLLFGFSNLSKNQELDAMLAAGFGLHRLARSTLILALGFAVISLVVFGWAQPFARYAYRSVVYEVQNVEAFFLAEEGVFMQAGSRTFILDSLNRQNNTFEKVFVFDEKENVQTETLTARKGMLVSVSDDPRPVLRLLDGRRLLNSFKLGDANAKPATSAGTFERFDTPLGKLSKNLFRSRGADERELTLTELFLGGPAGVATIPAQAMRSEFHHRLVSMFILPILPFLALPFASGRARSFRGYRIGLALVLVVAFHEIIEQGAVATKSGGISPWLAMWLPVGLLAAFSFFRFFRAAFYIQGSLSENWLGSFNDTVISIWAKVRRIKTGLS
jgi:lipopolysaccharide export system permease protein